LVGTSNLASLSVLIFPTYILVNIRGCRGLKQTATRVQKSIAAAFRSKSNVALNAKPAAQKIGISDAWFSRECSGNIACDRVFWLASQKAVSFSAKVMNRRLKAGYSLVTIGLNLGCLAALPPDYTGKPFGDSAHPAAAQTIPGKIECAYYDQGGEGVAYHDTDAINHGSGELNVKPEHHRPHATAYFWSFRANEGVDISYTKDFADFNHNNFVAPATNQLYIGWTADGEWCNYTVDVKKAGTYRILALYGNAANTVRFSVNHRPASECKLPLDTGSMHKWNKAEIGTITFPETGLQLLTFHYGKGNNFARFEFAPLDTE